MEFCPKCGGIMIPNGDVLVCSRCGYKRKIGKEEKEKVEKMLEEKVEKEEKIIVIDEDEEKKTYPKVKIICPKCGNDEAIWWVQQTRAADEPPTVFYKCTKCGYSWREY